MSIEIVVYGIKAHVQRQVSSRSSNYDCGEENSEDERKNCRDSKIKRHFKRVGTVAKRWAQEDVKNQKEKATREI